MPDSEVTLLLTLIDQGFDHRSWHGTNLKGSIRGMRAARAAWRPSPRRHNIWEIVVHAAYWKYAVRRRLLGEKRGSFPLAGSNWFARPVGGSADERAWRQDVSLLVETHARLRDAIAALTGRELDRIAPGSRVTTRALIAGIAAHDVYHAGQIQLLKRLTGC
jgi:hypothetical protein